MNHVRRWKTFVAVSCSHGHLIHAGAAKQVLDFCRDYNPDLRIHLGDAFDFSCLMKDAIRDGGGDESITEIHRGAEFLEQYRPNVWFMGNHEARPFELVDHHKAIVRDLAMRIVADIQMLAKSMRSEVVPYSGVYDPSCVRRIGNTAFMHGYSFAQNAPRNHVLLTGLPTVHGHTHTVDIQTCNQMGGPMGYAIGFLGDVSKMRYAHRKHKTASWKLALSYGRYNDDACMVTIKELEPWQKPSIKSIG